MDPHVILSGFGKFNVKIYFLVGIKKFFYILLAHVILEVLDLMYALTFWSIIFFISKKLLETFGHSFFFRLKNFSSLQWSAAGRPTSTMSGIHYKKCKTLTGEKKKVSYLIILSFCFC